MDGIGLGITAVKLIIDALDGDEFKSAKEDVASYITGEVKKMAGKLANGAPLLIKHNGSITSLVGEFIVSPEIIITDSIKNNSNIDKLIELNMDIFASFYLQAFNILTSHYGQNVNVAIELLGNSAGNRKFSKEEFTRDFLKELFSNEALDIDNKKSTDVNQPLTNIAFRTIDLSSTITYTDSKGVTKRHTVILPITVRASISTVSLDNVLAIMKPNSGEKSFDMRKLDYKAGIISLRNLIFCNDLIDEYKKDKKRDKADLSTTANDKLMSSINKIGTAGTKGFEQYYRLIIFNSTDMLSIHRQLSGDTKNEKYKQMLLEQTSSMCCTIIDENWDRGHIFIKDLPGESIFSVKKLGNRKESNIDLGEIVKALVSNKPPVF